MEQVIELARVHGWMSYHTLDSRGSSQGFADLALAWPSGRERRLLCRELKTEHGRVSPDQEWWMHALKAGGADVGVWRPSDWERIQAELAR